MFGLEDSGDGDSTITYAAYPGEKPVFSSGQEIKGWKKAKNEVLTQQDKSGLGLSARCRSAHARQPRKTERECVVADEEKKKQEATR